MKFAFTGPAKVNGIHFERKYLIELAKEKGHQVQNKVDESTDYLVRDPEFVQKKLTVKALNADVYHAQCITPESFLKKMEFL